MQLQIVENFKLFRARIRELRGESTLQAFSKKVGINLTTYQHYEAGTRKPNVKTILQIAVSCGVKTDWLLGISEESGKQASGSFIASSETCIECLKKEAVIDQQLKTIMKLSGVNHDTPTLPSTRSGGGCSASRKPA